MKTRRRFLGALVASAMAIGLLPARAVLGADPETYNVWIGGKQVTSENMDDVLGSGSGSVKYDPATSTLTLDKPAFSKSTHESGAQIYAEGVNLTIRGTAGIEEGDDCAICIKGGNLTVETEDLKATGNDTAIFAEKDITFNGNVYLQSKIGTDLISVPNGKIEISDDFKIWQPKEGKLDDAKKKILDKDGLPTYYAMIVPKKVNVIWKAGAGNGTDIVENADFGSDVYYKKFPSDWTEPEGMHFDGWYYAEENHYEYCAGGWVEGLLKFGAYGDATMTARYKYWITGWEDTGDNGVYMPFGCIAQERGILKEGGDVHFDAGEHLPIEICLQKGFVLKDNKVEIVSAKSGEVLATVSVIGHDYEKYTCFYTECDMPDEDVTLRFATKNQSGVTVKYEVTDSTGGSWDPESGEDFKLTVHRDPDDENCIYYFESVTLDGTELVKDVDYTAEAGSTKITVKASALASLADGSHDISVNFTDGKAPVTFSVGKKTAGSTTPGTTPGNTSTTPGNPATTPDSGKTQPVDNSTTNSVNNTGSGAANTSPAPVNTPDTNTTTDGSNNAVNNTPVNNNGTVEKKKNTTTGKIAKTGDTGRTLIPLALVFLAISGGAVVILLVRNRRPKNEYDKLKHIVKRV